MEGIDADKVSAWLAEQLGLALPVSFELIAGGRSNLTYKVSAADGAEVVLRRPPTGSVLPTAHDMSREHRIISALYETAVPVPKPLGLCLDEEVNGAPFYVMEHVRGHVLRDRAAAEALLDEKARARASASLVEVLARLHLLAPDSVGLGDLARREGYLARQLARWHGQFEKSQVPGTARPVVVDEVYEKLSAALPEQEGTAIVHGDYRLDNTMLSPRGEVVAVLDWEICTLGDALADVGLLMVYWSEPGDAMNPLNLSPTLAAGFLSRRELRQAYAESTGRDLAGLDYYVAFGYWKLACILQGVLFRYLAGAAGGDRSGVESFAENVRLLGEAAASFLRALA